MVAGVNFQREVPSITPKGLVNFQRAVNTKILQRIGRNSDRIPAAEDEAPTSLLPRMCALTGTPAAEGTSDRPAGPTL